MTANSERLIVALDLSDPDRARALARQLSPLGVSFKIGLELFMAGGPELVAELAARYRLFLDLKFHDIPNTAAAAVREAASLGVWMINLHASGGKAMLLAAREAVAGLQKRPLLIAVTVLTSISEHDLRETGSAGSVLENVVLMARLAAQSGFDGVVCSPLEIAAVKAAVSETFLTITPGVRPFEALINDQQRVANPSAVIAAGGDYLVVGRPITTAADPVLAARKILGEMGSEQ
ncbi:MAG: orotidine-5'-phosphate decarboxylase [Dethiobacteria bacterium]|nr:orotidine-5'-phosphate decarboxylase [Dethiobacteria bacterium]